MTNFELIANIEFDNSYTNVLDFVSRETQESFFDNKVEYTFDNFTTVKENEVVKIPKSINDIININYCRYLTNINNVERTIFAFITHKEYVNEETTRLTLETDVYQTYMFDYNIKESFIERQHKDRFIKVNGIIVPVFDKVPENLEIGKNYKQTGTKTIYDPCQSFYENGNPRSLMWYYIVAKEKIGTVGKITNINGINTGVYVYFLPVYFYTGDTLSENIIRLENSTQQALKIETLIENVNILSLSASRIAPYDYTLVVDNGNWVIQMDASAMGGSLNVKVSNVDNNFLYVLENHEQPFREISLGISQKTFTLDYNNLISIENETKLMTNPYAFYKLRSDSDELIINEENFDNYNEKIFEYLKTFSTKNTAILKLKNYLGNDNLTASKVIALDSEITLRQDAWLNYEAQNKASLKSGMLSGMIQTATGIGLGALTGGIGLAVAGASAINTGFGIFNALQKQQDIKQQSDNVVNNIGDISLNVVKNNLYFRLEHYEIEDQFKEIIFKFFMHFGYASHTFEIPNLKSRYYYNYIKTQGINLTANIDNEILTKLKSIYDNGVTIWHYRDASTFKGILNFNFENKEMNL